MHDAHEFLRSLTLVLVVAALVTVVFQRLKQPVVLGYIIAGLILGPHVAVPLVADRSIVQTLSELGVILLMFSLGLEFRLGKLLEVGPRAGLTAIIEAGLMTWLGVLAGRLLGWTTLESVFAGAIVAISSTTIIAKVFDERGIIGSLRELVVGILLFEDLIVVVFMAALTAASSGAGLSSAHLIGTLARLAAFLVVLLVAGMLAVPAAIRFVSRIGRRETTLVASIGVCFGVAYLARWFGYSVALGAFLAGSLVAESGEGPTIEGLVEPIRDMFVAVFFVSVGLSIDPAVIGQHWGWVLVLASVVIVGKVTSVALGAFLTGNGTRTALKAGMSMTPIGEFSFIIAGIGVASGATRDFLYPVAVAVSAITTLTSPWLIAAAGPVAAFVDRKLPHALQTYASLYGAWLERLRTQRAGRRFGPVGRSIRLLALDTAAVAAISVGAGVTLDRSLAPLADGLRLPEGVLRGAVVAVVLLLALPFVVGMTRLALRLGRLISNLALPEVAAGKVDFDAAPRRVLTATIKLGIALAVAAVVMAVTQPFLPSIAGPAVIIVLLIGFGVAIWRGATNLQGHVLAGAEAVVHALASYSRSDAVHHAPKAMSDLHELMPGLGAPVAVRLDAACPSVGRSLAELNLRGLTGASVLAISRGGQAIVVPQADERLQAGDLLGLVGTGESVAAAREMLTGSGTQGDTAVHAGS